MRGGTKKGAYFLAGDLPQQAELRDQVLLAAMGSPDSRQIDGIGGATGDASKVAIVQRSAHPGADVDYVFAQVQVNEAHVDYSRNCGNLLAGVGPFAIERALVAVTGDLTPVRILMVNTGQIVIAQVPTPAGVLRYQGDAQIDEVPGQGAPLMLEFENIAGSTCGALLPTGNATDRIDGVQVTCIDYGTPLVLISAQEMGCSGYESPEQLDVDDALKTRLESIRQLARPLMKLGVANPRGLPKICLVAPPLAGGAISTRSFLPKRSHPGMSVLAAVCVAVGCLLEGTVAQRLVHVSGGPTHRLSVEHPSGEFTVELQLRSGQLKRCGLMRTARLLFDGVVCVPRALWDGSRADSTV